MLVLCLLGLVLLYYDRSFLRGIDYFGSGIAKARATINTEGSSGSLYSFFGNLFSYLYIVPIYNILIEWEIRQRKMNWLILAISIILVFSLSLLMGGRTAMLIAFTVAISALIARRTMGLSLMPSNIRPKHLLIAASALMLFFGMIFHWREKTFSGYGSHSYLVDLCNHLTVFSETTLTTCNIGSSGVWYEDYINYGQAIFMYAFHPLWITEHVASHYSFGASGTVLTAGMNNLLANRLGIEAMPHLYAGFFVPTASSTLNDLGWTGLIIFSTITGIILKVATTMLRAGLSWFGRWLFILMMSSIMLSLIIAPLNLPGLIIYIVTSVSILSATSIVRASAKTLSR